MELECIRTLYEFPHYLRAEMLPDEATLRAAYDYEYGATIGKRKESHYYAGWDLDSKNRKPNYDLLVVIAAILKSEELFERILDFKREVAWDYYAYLRKWSKYNEDAGRPVPSNVLLDQLFDAGRKLLNWAGKNKTTDSIYQTLLMFKDKFYKTEKD